MRDQRERSQLSRRTFTAAGLAACFIALGRSRVVEAATRWGPPIPDPRGILDLPAEFHYEILETVGDAMSDGYRVPARADGMACFAAADGKLILMRNHENSLGARNDGPYLHDQAVAPEAYDADGMGGVTRLVVDPESFERVSSNLVLIGTSRNCAGGPSPWGWLSCEESVVINGGLRHGYVFLCRTDAEQVQPPDRKPGYGRFFHEAAAVDPSTNIAYLTEDRADGCVYRFVPDQLDAPFVGKLQALAVVGKPQFTTEALEAGAVLEVEWVDIDEPDPAGDTVRSEATKKGAAIIRRGEGMWFHDGQVFFSATIGGPIGKGQLFRLIDGAQPTLEVLYASADLDALEMPDNITIAPWGELFVVEDGPGTNSIRWLGTDGKLQHFGRTSLSEITGICFSPDARAMFLNIQVPGLTLVVTGPFTDDDGNPGGGSGGVGGSGDGESAGTDPSSEPPGCGCDVQ